MTSNEVQLQLTQFSCGDLHIGQLTKPSADPIDDGLRRNDSVDDPSRIVNSGVDRRINLDRFASQRDPRDLRERQRLTGQLHHLQLLEMLSANSKSCSVAKFRLQQACSGWEKGQATNSGLAFWLKLSAGGQLGGYFEYVEVVGAGVSFF